MLTTGSNNLDIANQGASTDSNTIRIGTTGVQTATYIAGISKIPLTSTADLVVVGLNGQLGLLGSSARYKRNIKDIGDGSDRLMKLRPVSFLYKADDSGALQYGLIAEEVASVYPELVVYGDDGKPEAVRYLMLTSLLLNEAQKQDRISKQQSEALKRLTDQNRRQSEQIKALTTQLAAVQLATQRQLAAQRAGIERRLGVLEQAMAIRSDGKRMASASAP